MSLNVRERRARTLSEVASCAISTVVWLTSNQRFALSFHTYSTWRGRRGVWLADLFVLPELRGRGLGKALLSRLAAIAIERDCARFEWSVLDWNQSAIGFYQRLGAQVLESWRICRISDTALKELAAQGTP